MFFIELFEDVGLEFTVETDGLDDLSSLFVRGCLNEVSDLRGTQLCQFAIGNAHPSRGDMRYERFNAFPVDDATRDNPVPPRPRQDASDRTSTTRIDSNHLPNVINKREFNLVCT